MWFKRNQRSNIVLECINNLNKTQINYKNITLFTFVHDVI